MEGKLAELLDEIVRAARAAVGDVQDVLGAELQAAALSALWHPPDFQLDAEPEQLLVESVYPAIERGADARALAALRALALVEDDGRAAGAADRLAASGVTEPAWAPVPPVRPLRAALMRDPHFDDAHTVLVEFERDGEGRHVLGLLVDRSQGGFAKDALGADTLDEVQAMTAGALPGLVAFDALDLGEARARIEDALDQTAHMLEAPISDELGAMRVLLLARARLLPEGHTVPEPEPRSPGEREELVRAFLKATGGRRFARDEVAWQVLDLAVDFAEDHRGNALMWSPGVVEQFMVDWLPRVVGVDDALADRVPELLPAWVRYAGRVRKVPKARAEEAAAAVAEHSGALHQAVAGGGVGRDPAHALAAALISAGVDLEDPDAVAAFISEFGLPPGSAGQP
ncbi:MAG: hypothetical protein ACR2NB_02120 [Solirubrobacteraceae bacterium]